MRIISSSNLRCEVVAETADVITNNEKQVIEKRKKNRQPAENTVID